MLDASTFPLGTLVVYSSRLFPDLDAGYGIGIVVGCEHRLIDRCYWVFFPNAIYSEDVLDKHYASKLRRA